MTRHQAVDVARGVAFVAMVIYHATWFAADRGLVDVPIHEALAWRAFQKSIAGSFFLLVGVSLFLANARGIAPRRVAWRLGKIGGCALIVTAGSLVLQPAWVVTFGILHCIALCSVVGLAFLRLGAWNLLLAAVAAGAGVWLSHGAFDHPLLRWTGLGTVWAPTFDFQPFLPWFGVVLLGIWAGDALVPRVADWGSSAVPARVLTWAGRHALGLYMVHVPVLVIGVEVLARASGT